jgi:heme/copper-type cytochrome/quinol oxidase subunit 2
MTKALIIALVLLILGVGLLALFFVRLVRRLKFKSDGESKKKIPGGVSYIAIVVAIFMLIVSWALLKTTNHLKSFRPYKPSTGICRTTIAYEGDPVKTLKMELVLTGIESQTVPTTFYLSGNSWYLRGQYVKLPAFLAYIYQWQSYYKVTDFYSDFAGHKPPGVNEALLAHQEIGGGSAGLMDFLNAIPFIKNKIEACEFETKPIKVIDRIAVFEAILGDSCQIILNRTR